MEQTLYDLNGPASYNYKNNHSLGEHMQPWNLCLELKFLGIDPQWLAINRLQLSLSNICIRGECIRNNSTDIFIHDGRTGVLISRARFLCVGSAFLLQDWYLCFLSLCHFRLCIWWIIDLKLGERPWKNCYVAVESLHFPQRMTRDTASLDILEFDTFTSAQAYERCSLAVESHRFQQLTLIF